jgi:hypothetical protein
MIEHLPEGISIGWMQAPPNWIFTHTVRFVGIVRVVIQDGEGYILINKGKPLIYYFKHGRIELRGHAALDYFNSHPIIEFNLCKYTTEEFEEALKICNVEEQTSVILPQPERKPVSVPEPPEPVPAQAPGVIPAPFVPPAAAPDIYEDMPVSEVQPPAPEEVIERVPEKPVVKISSRPVPPPPTVFTSQEAASVPPAIPSQQVILDDADIKIIGQIKKLNGVVAISVFNDERNIILMGDVEIEPLLKIARNMLETIRKISPHIIEWGSFVHTTLQIPEGNVIIAPYRQYYLCLLTTRTINIGHIRRILRDLQIDGRQE